MSDERLGFDKELDNAVAECRRFMQRVKEYRARIKRDKEQHIKVYQMPERGAVKRASLDLSRALARLRKGQVW